MILIQVHQQFFSALLDSGSQQTLIRADFLKKFGSKIRPVPLDKPQRLNTANNQSMPVIGVASLPVKIEGLLMPFDFLVVEDLSVNCILGTDFMSFSNCVLDFTQQTVQFCDNVIAVNMLKRFDILQNMLALMQTIKIQPRAEYFVPVCVQNPDMVPHQETQMMVNPSPCF